MKMVNFVAGVLLDLPSRARVVSVEVGDEGYLLTVSLPGGGLSTHHLSPWDVSRGLRGDREALAAIRAGLAPLAMAV